MLGGGGEGGKVAFFSQVPLLSLKISLYKEKIKITANYLAIV